MALAERGRHAAQRGDLQEARAGMELANRNYNAVGLAVAKDLSDSTLREALENQTFINRYAEAALEDTLRSDR